MTFIHWHEINKKHFPSPGRVQIVYAPLDKENSAHYFDLLSDQEKARSARLKNKVAANRQIIARGILRRVLGQTLRMKPEELMFRNNPHNKPCLSHPADSGISFNLAHSGNLLLIALANEKHVGVDVEVMDHHRDFAAISRLVFSPEEQASLSHSMQPVQDFYTLWTVKESILKAAGRGFSFSPNQLRVTSTNGSVSLSSLPAELSSGGTCKLFSFLPARGYTAAVAVLT
jgi:4'-phosphopantetheinyl transferase